MFHLFHHRKMIYLQLLQGTIFDESQNIYQQFGTYLVTHPVFQFTDKIQTGHKKHTLPTNQPRFYIAEFEMTEDQCRKFINQGDDSTIAANIKRLYVYADNSFSKESFVAKHKQFPLTFMGCIDNTVGRVYSCCRASCGSNGTYPV